MVEGEVVMRKRVEIVVYELEDETSSMLRVDRLVVRFGPQRIRWSGNPKFEEMMEGHETSCEASELPKGAARRRSAVEAALERLMGGVFDHRLVESDAAVTGVGCALEAAGLLLDDDDDEAEEDVVYELVAGRSDDAMRLDSAAARAANVFDDGDETSILGVLDHTKTAMGHRELERRLRSPLVDAKKIEERLDRVEALVEAADEREEIREKLHGVPDVAKYATKLRKKAATLVDLHKIHQFASKVLPGLTAHAEELRKPASELERLDAMAVATLDLSFLPEIFLNAKIDPSLQESANAMREARDAVDEAHFDAAQSWASNVLRKQLPDDKTKWQLKLEKDTQRGFVFRSPKPVDEKTILSKAQEFCVLSYLKNGVYLTSETLTKATDAYRRAKQEYAKDSKALTEELMATAATYAPVLETVARVVAVLDVEQSLAQAAVFGTGGPYCRPRFGGCCRLSRARHPCVETKVESFIANDYDFSNHTLTIVTGPNMGGKSTYIRAIAAIAVVAQIGSFVPAESADLRIFDAVLARVGAGDNLHRGVSTFMAEMLDAATILDTATKNSLVVVDELGRGTSTYDGFGLAWAIADYLAGRGCVALFATHFHELTDLSEHNPNVANLHVAATAENDGDITFLYDVRPGPCSESFGIQVAKLAGFPEDAIAVAKRKALALESSHTTNKKPRARAFTSE
ncbi:hypothetical protein CTAYLR_008718 [Chrysophaeum taylorii]|uniref:DNA mismatch repair proteins mutS family domain-containing protein n=1 Tax=Chrysophaeum taylorii TaxID=2483200 RepID=A0AAD7XN76_9STRA|nr:hypothetical protein CTAYLR_008718 [Chrysophaeum taylorii]